MQYLLKILPVVILFGFSSLLMGEQMDAENVVKQIAHNENLIQDVQCIYRWLEPETNLKFEYEWGYQNGKEFRSGTENGQTPDGEILPFTRIIAFDGKVVRSHAQIQSLKTSQGGIYGYDPFVFSVPTSPKTLLGYTLDQDGIYTLSELLSNKYVKEKNARLEKLGDIECIVLEAIGFRTADDKSLEDIRIWIDPARNFRPLKIEKFQSPDQNSSFAALKGERWKYLTMTIDNIELAKIDGIWFPVCGEQVTYETKAELLLEGKTEEEIIKQYPGMTNEEIAKEIKWVSVPFHAKRRTELREIKINKGIDPAKFTIVFPAGCRLWDDMVGIGYVVGDLEGVVSRP